MDLLSAQMAPVKKKKAYLKVFVDLLVLPFIRITEFKNACKIVCSSL